jgi:hypothetical protein
VVEGKAEDKPICFVIMPISDAAGYEPGHFGRVYEHVIKPAVLQAGFQPIRADDTNKTDYIVINIVRMVVESAIVLCDYSAKNPNVMYELGVRHAFNLPVVLIKDRSTDKVFDIQGLRYTEYDETLRVDSVQKDIARIKKAVEDTAKADSTSYNSIVQLAGLTAAKVPDRKEVSGDTQLIMSAIAALEQRLDAVSGKPVARHLRFENDAVVLNDGDVARVGDAIHDYHKKVHGVVHVINPTSEIVLVRDQKGTLHSYFAKSPDSRQLTTLPF